MRRVETAIGLAGAPLQSRSEIFLVEYVRHVVCTPDAFTDTFTTPRAVTEIIRWGWRFAANTVETRGADREEL